MTPPGHDPLKYRELLGHKRRASAAEVHVNNPEDLLFSEPETSQWELRAPAPADSDGDDAWAVPDPLPEAFVGDQSATQWPDEAPAETPEGLHRNPLPSALDTSAVELRGAGDQLAGAVGTTKRQPMPRSADHRAHANVQKPTPAVPWGPPVAVVTAGLGAAACFGLLAQNYPIAILVALLGMVGAALVRLILQASSE